MQNERIESRKSSKNVWISLLVIVVLIPLTIAVTWHMGGRKYYVASVIIIFLSMIPFFASFESRKPQARELSTLAVMCAIAVASRAVFFALPNFKPIGGIVMITAMAFGPQAGFMTGSLSMIVSNMLFGQGPWTPWQMFGYGLLGFVTGLLARKGIMSEEKPLRNGIIGFVLMVLMVGPILDTCTVLTMAHLINPESLLAVYIAGIPVSVSQGIAVMLCLVFLTKPLLSKLNRIKVKYGLME